MDGFSGTNVKCPSNFVIPAMEKDRPDNAVIHIRSNDITHKTARQIEMKDMANHIINIGKKCLSYRAKEVILSPVLIKK